MVEGTTVIDESIVLQKLYRLREIVETGHFIPGNEHDLGTSRWYVNEWIYDITLKREHSNWGKTLIECNRMWKDYR